ncbi:hypothetical protein PG997_011805 [Apiospora hydei]|uniref:Rhodopsin domain-containing protein n=1 Tax=Apiospora hydei TaxID=1337664 RepID=A0ABR1V4Y3_9PEZI
MSYPGFANLPAERQHELLEGAALKPPKGVESNFAAPEQMNGLAIAVASICLAFTTAIVILRIISRVALKRIYMEDCMLRLERPFPLGSHKRVMVEANSSRKAWDSWLTSSTLAPLRAKLLTPDASLTRISVQIILIGSIFYALVIVFLKVAIMLEWLRIFVPNKVRNAFFWTCWLVLVLNVVYYVINITLLNVACTPYRANWDITVDGSCRDPRAVELTSAAMNLISDVVMVVMIQKVIWGLQMSIKAKIGVSVMFAAGIFACIAGGFRLGTTVVYLRDHDLTYSVSSVIMWAIGEMTSAFLVLCVPAIPSSFKFLRGKALRPPRKQPAAGPWRGPAPLQVKGPSRGTDSDQLPLTNAPRVYCSQSSEDALHIPVTASRPRDGIVRTTDWTIEDERSVSTDRQYPMHPWAGKQQQTI